MLVRRTGRGLVAVVDSTRAKAKAKAKASGSEENRASEDRIEGRAEGSQKRPAGADPEAGRKLP
eukprot:1872356-Heterocapsa_arctica.AAC.1